VKLPDMTDVVLLLNSLVEQHILSAIRSSFLCPVFVGPAEAEGKSLDHRNEALFRRALAEAAFTVGTK